MAFRKVINYHPYQSKMDPRVDSQWAINSNYMVMAVTHHKTYNELILNKKTIGDMKVVGLISDHSVSESTSSISFFEVGNKREIIIPGKTLGRLQLSSQIIESVNLLGSIYETVIDGYKDDPILGKAMQALENDVMFRPFLSQSYSEESDLGGVLQSPVDTGLTPNLGGILPSVGSPDYVSLDGLKANGSDLNSRGALLLSIFDNRLKVKFGLSFLMFQNVRRITRESVEGGFLTTGNLTEEEIDNSINIDDPNWTDQVEVPSQYDDTYRLLGGVFFENCLITDYNRNVNTQEVGPNYIETINVKYNGSRNLQPFKGSGLASQATPGG